MSHKPKVASDKHKDKMSRKKLDRKQRRSLLSCNSKRGKTRTPVVKTGKYVPALEDKKHSKKVGI